MFFELLLQSLQDLKAHSLILAFAALFNLLIEAILIDDTGKVIEYDSPAQLLRDNTSAFSNLVMEFLRRSSKVDK